MFGRRKHVQSELSLPSKTSNEGVVQPLNAPFFVFSTVHGGQTTHLDLSILRELEGRADWTECERGFTST